MGGWCTFAHVGSFIVSQCRYDFRRHSKSHSGSPFFPEIRRITSSLRPTGTVSDSMSVTNPARYSRAAMSLAVIESELMCGEGPPTANLLNLYEKVKDQRQELSRQPILYDQRRISAIMTLSRAFKILILLMIPGAALAREEEAPAVPIVIHRSAGPITIDGDLSDEGWKGAARVETWYEVQPGDNTPP